MTSHDSQLTTHGVATHDSRLTSHDVAISVKNLSKSFRMYPSPKEKLKELLHPFGKKYHQEFWALKDVSVEVKKGECIGIIGRNGSGKSTLLQIICGVLQPTTGEAKVNGRISALLELGAGFNKDFTGRENVYMNGALMGCSREEMDERFEVIADFADIGDFIEQPVKTYSSGMYVRLAFACAVNVDPDILIVDEALSVGDMFFQAKCMTKMKKMIDSGITLLFVSHSTGTIKSLCKNAMLLESGEMIEFSSAEKVVETYFAMKVKQEQSVVGDALPNSALPDNPENPKYSVFSQNEEFIRKASFQRIQNGKAGFVNVQLLDKDGREIGLVEFNQVVTLRMAIELYEDVHELSYGYHIRDRNGVDVVYSSGGIENKRLQFPKKGERYIVDWTFKASLMEGNYTVACVIAIALNDEIGKVDFCDFVPIAVQFSMSPRRPVKLWGFVHWDNSVEITKY